MLETGELTSTRSPGYRHPSPATALTPPSSAPRPLTISSPGLQLSTRSARRMASLERGSRPAATLPGLS